VSRPGFEEMADDAGAVVDELGCLRAFADAENPAG
jgi:hypothetical protein